MGCRWNDRQRHDHRRGERKRLGKSKRAKEHRELIEGLGKGDEVMTNGGLAGKIVKVEEQFVLVEVAAGVELRFQKAAVSAALPKGTLKS